MELKDYSEKRIIMDFPSIYSKSQIKNSKMNDGSLFIKINNFEIDNLGYDNFINGNLRIIFIKKDRLSLNR